MPQERLYYLFTRIFADEATPDERKEFFLLVEDNRNDPALKSLVDQLLENGEVYEKLDDETSRIILSSIFAAGREAPVRPLTLFRKNWLRYAAVLILVIGAASFFFWYRPQKTTPPVTAYKPALTDIAPGKEGAILTLADGSKVLLDSLGNGVVATQNGVKVLLENRQLAYDSRQGADAALTYNTVTTPKGRQFRVVLPDGTKVWLNAASSVRYPIAFDNKQRTVSITGEAYFEVVHDASRPFIVNMNDHAAVQVLGTSFNLNTYRDEDMLRATLLTGSLKVMAGNPKAGGIQKEHELILKPGQQAQIMQEMQQGNSGKEGHNIIGLVENADQDRVMAWRRGFFSFKRASLEEVMRQLCRWYDIDVKYEKGIPDIHFGGELSRDLNLSELLKVLEDSKVHFRMEEGRMLVVEP